MPETRSQTQITDGILAVLQPQQVAFQQTHERQMIDQQQDIQTLKQPLLDQTVAGDKSYKQYESNMQIITQQLSLLVGNMSRAKSQPSFKPSLEV